MSGFCREIASGTSLGIAGWLAGIKNGGLQSCLIIIIVIIIGRVPVFLMPCMSICSWLSVYENHCLFAHKKRGYSPDNNKPSSQ